ncbi:MAG: hypothetical protein IKN26_00630 [Eubacterium sp.]|nr:hypothetical protein [Eubacterium sp.]
MEKQTINIKITTQGEKCEMSTKEIENWYKENISSLFNPEYGTPEIEVSAEREVL